MTKNTMDTMRDWYQTLSEGEKIYLANKLWKEDRIVAQKIKQYIPEETQLRFAVGEEFYIGKGYIVEVDPEDSSLPYKIQFDDDTTMWVSENYILNKGCD